MQASGSSRRQGTAAWCGPLELGRGPMTTNRFMEINTLLDLMPFKVQEILLVANLYDAFILEKDGHLAERIWQEYSVLNLLHVPRVTRVGKFIRKHSIDEMPQLINVLMGDMSIVGPRPYLKEELDEQMEQLEDLDEDFDLEEGDVGLE